MSVACFISVDPLQFKYPIYTPYQYAGNKPVSNSDLDGAEPKDEVNEEKNATDVVYEGEIEEVVVTAQRLHEKTESNIYFPRTTRLRQEHFFKQFIKKI